MGGLVSFFFLKTKDTNSHVKDFYLLGEKNHSLMGVKVKKILYKLTSSKQFLSSFHFPI